MKFKVSCTGEQTFFGIMAKDGDKIDSKDWGDKEEFFIQKALKMPEYLEPVKERKSAKSESSEES